MTKTYAELAERLRDEGADENAIMNYALLAIADQMRASNEVAIIQILINMGLTTPNTPSFTDLRNVREHLYSTLGWDDLSPEQGSD